MITDSAARSLVMLALRSYRQHPDDPGSDKRDGMARKCNALLSEYVESFEVEDHGAVVAWLVTNITSVQPPP